MKKHISVILVVGVLVAVAMVVATRNPQRQSAEAPAPVVQTNPAPVSKSAPQAFDAWQTSLKLDTRTDYQSDAAASERLRSKLTRDPAASDSKEERK